MLEGGSKEDGWRRQGIDAPPPLMLRRLTCISLHRCRCDRETLSSKRVRVMDAALAAVPAQAMMACLAHVKVIE